MKKVILTEQANKDTANIDLVPTLELVELLNNEDKKVALAVEKEKKNIAKAIDLITEKVLDGGNLLYFGAGTSGRLGVLDASECPPTFGVTPNLVRGYIAGGDVALRNAIEGAEDNYEQGKIDFAEGKNGYNIDCLYESSCGAVVFRKENDDKIKYLLIRNRRSAHWGFPKGHIEPGESDEETAIREVLEETGLHINILPGFVKKSNYTIQGKIEKSVSIFGACTDETKYSLQVEEIEECGWFEFDAKVVDEQQIAKLSMPTASA